MIFRVVGMKEVDKKIYNIDVLFYAESQEYIKEMLHDLGVVTLDINPYDGDAQSFGTTGIIITYKEKDVSIVSNLTNLRMVAHKFILMGFTIKTINFLDSHKMSDEAADDLLKTVFRDIDIEKSMHMDEDQSEEKQQEVAYHDEALENTLAVAKWQINDINENIYSMGANISSNDLKDIKSMEQDLGKLKMGRNMDKIVDLLEKVLVKALDIKQKYLQSQRQNERQLFDGTGTTDVDVLYEVNLFDKAKSMAVIKRLRTFDDQYYGSLGLFGIPLKFLGKDIQRKITDISTVISATFEFLKWIVLFVSLSTVFVLWYKGLGFDKTINSYYYVILIMFGIAGLLEFFLSRFEKKDVVFQLLIMAAWGVLSLVLFLFVKYLLVF